MLPDVTERKQIEKVHRSAHERLQHLIAGSPGVLYTCEPSGDYRVTSITENVSSLWGYEPREFLEDPRFWADRIHPQDAASVFSGLTRLLDVGHHSHEYRFCLKRGEYRWLRAELRLVRDSAGKPVEIIGHCMDISEHKKTEEERERLLRDMQERVKELRCIYGVAKATQTRETLAEAFQDIVALIPPAWQYPEITRARINFDGKEYVSEIFQEAPWKQISDIVIGGKKQGAVEVYYLEERPQLDEGPFLKEEHHLLDGIAHSLSVAIERKWAEEALRLAEADYRSIFDNAIEGIYRLTEAGRFLTANPALARMLGYGSPEDLIQNVANIRDQLFVDPRQRDEFMRLLLSNDSVWGFEAKLYRRDGSMIWTLENARAVRDPKGELLYYEGTIQNITARKEAEETLHMLSGRLLTVQDEERRRIARELHDGVAQDLVALKMELGTLRKPTLKLGPKVRKILFRVLRMATRSLRNIRTLSHLLHPPELDELGLAPVLSSYVGGFSARSGIRVDLDISGRLGRLPQDVEIALFRVVQESLTNVHRHARSRTAKVRLSVRPGEVSVEIADKGSGICFEKLEKIRAGGANLGVGIAGMQERVKQLGGKLVITSNRGTRVRAMIPFCEDIG